MAPALTKITKDGHGVHLSSLASSNMDSDGGAMFSIELDPQMKLTEDSYSQKMWLNLSSLPFLNSCVSKSLLEFPDTSLLTPSLQASDGQYKAVFLPGPGSLLSLLSLNKSLKDPHQVAVVHPGAPDMFLVPVPDYNSQEASLLRRHSSGPASGPDGGDGPQPPPPPLCHSNIQPLHCPAVLTHPTAGHQGEVVLDCHLPVPVQPCGARSDSDRSLAEAMLEEAVGDQTQRQLSRQADLLSRAGGLQRRLLAMLGEHVLLHYSLQLEGLKKRLQTRGSSSVTPRSKPPSAQGHTARSNARHPPPEPCRPLSPSAELQEFGRSGQAVLRGLQEALDSDATASSSSDDEPEQERNRLGIEPLPICSSERRWQAERTEVGSRWSWLQLRLEELEGRVQQLRALHQHISSTKGGVLLAETQPLTDGQIQQILLRETAGLSCTVGSGGGDLSSDGDNEPSSPTRLLRNIERQSAQLSQIVHSLSPFPSPVCKGLSKRAFNSSLYGDETLILGGTKRRKIGARKRRQLLQANASCVCARTRPLVTYHKPRLYTLPTHPAIGSTSSSSSGSLQDMESSTSSSFSSCPTCSSCDPLALCSDPACSSSSPLTSRTSSCRPHPVLSLSSDTPLSHHLQSALAREHWIQKPVVVLAESSPGYYHRLGRSSTPLHNSYHHKHYAKQRRGGVRGVSPVRWVGSAQTPHRRAFQGRRTRRRVYRVMEDGEDFLYQLSDPEDGSEEGLEETYTPQSSHTHKQGRSRRRQGESVFNIDNIVIPVSLTSSTKVEKLQYKYIITPCWREVDTRTLEQREREEDEEEKVELLTEEAFAQRHQASEEREKLRWSSWGKRRCYRRTSRSGSRWSGSGEGVYAWECPARGEESSAEWSCSLLDPDDQTGNEEWLPQVPWEQRVFPLGADEEEALRSDPEEPAQARWPERSSITETSATTADDSKSHVSQLSRSALSSSATSPSAGHIRNITPDGKIT